MFFTVLDSKSYWNVGEISSDLYIRSYRSEFRLIHSDIVYILLVSLLWIRIHVLP